MGDNVYRLQDDVNFLNFCIKTSHKKQEETLGESLINEVKSGPFVFLDGKNYNYKSCFYINNEMVGPSFKVSRNKFEYSYSNGVVPHTNYRIKYEAGNFYIGLYNKNGLFSGKEIRINSQNEVSFVLAKEFSKKTKEESANIKFNKLHTKIIDEVPYGGLADKKKLYKVPVMYSGSSAHNITFYGAMYADRYDDSLRVFRDNYDDVSESVRKLNKEFKKGYGYYPYGRESYGLGYIKRGTNLKNVGFVGVCIFKKKDGLYEIGNRFDDLKSGLCLISDFNRCEYEIATFLSDERVGISIKINNQGIVITSCLNNKFSDALFIDSNLNLRMQYENGKIKDVKYPFENTESQVSEKPINNNEYNENSLAESSLDSIKEKYKCFEYDVRYQKETSNGQTKMLPRVTLKSTIGINYFITIPEEVEGFSEDFKHDMSSVSSLEINSRYLKEINQNMASSMSRLKQLKVGDNFNGNIGSNVFRRSKLKAITLPKGVRKIEKHAFVSSLLLQEAHVYLHTKVEEEAFPETCAIFYYGALTKEEIKRQNQLNKEAKKVLKNSKKHHKEQLQLEEKFSKQKQNGRVPNWLFEKQENERYSVFNKNQIVNNKSSKQKTPIKKNKKQSKGSTSLFTKIKDFFVSTIKNVRISPMILILLLLLITGLYIFIGQVGAIDKLTFGLDLGVSGTFGQNLLNNYDFKLASLIIDLFGKIGEIGGDTPNLLGILVKIILWVLSGVAFLLCGVIDLVVYVLIIVVLWLLVGIILNLLFQFLMYLGIPLFVPVFTIIVSTKHEEKLFPIITAIISSLGTIYYIVLFVMYVINYN